MTGLVDLIGYFFENIYFVKIMIMLALKICQSLDSIAVCWVAQLLNVEVAWGSAAAIRESLTSLCGTV